MKIGILESNGEQNYVNWEMMYKAHPCGEEKFARCVNGLYILEEDFYRHSGGIFDSSDYYNV